MATITTTTSTPTPTPTPSATSTANVTKNAAQSILTSLNTGSGVDTASLVSSLVQAQFAAKTAALAAKNTKLTAQISAAGTLKNTITNFSTALGSLTAGGTLQSQPVSSNGSVLSASAISGTKMGNLSSSVTVTALASAQGARSAAVDSRTTPIGTGKLTLTLGTATYNTAGTAMTAFTAGSTAAVSIDVTNGSIDGIATAINAAKTGVTASVITDQDGKAVLSLKGTTGSAQAFTLKADTAGSPLEQFNVGVGKGTLTGTAANAKLTVDGVDVQRSSNTISDLIPGVKLQLNAVSGSAVSLTSSRPTTALSQAVSDFVETYNQVYASAKDMTNAITGDLKEDAAAKTLLRSLQGLTTKTMASASAVGAPTTLAQIGIATNRDGTLSVNTDTLNKVLAAYPDEVEAMFATTSSNALGLNSSLSGISIAASSSLSGLGASTARYTKAQTDLTSEQDKISAQSDSMNTRLTQQFSSMNSKVSAYKASQTFLERQLKAWEQNS
ncbi:flagellar hook-associated protein 2 [Sphingomonas insulae]|uniref:Flagellar hook-associated protein 2 n=1 Tax=Sphingomonas insulae TaxID=424800 RepID=A0ABN1HMB2_9SPHN|nr:flagellar filament capping protein FliD [Sphingomonas insulae]NIJ30070.1 flagellar hook-associated protein 2 [Sphingomonas insulae]